MKLYDELLKYAEDNVLPMHMPGHKRNPEYTMTNPYAWDITEIDGFDNLHEPEGILLEGKNLASRIYGSDESYFLVNGSTAGILAGICACTNPGDTILAARNCHKSVYHALIMNGLKPVYLHPFAERKTGIFGSISPAEVYDCLQQYHPSLVIVTSPTYEGILSDIRTIAAICHEHNIPLMVDEAHGAHLKTASQPFSPFPESALCHGADLVVQSLHKTLPSLTSTALLHRKGSLVNPAKLKFFLDVYQTSSPSYVLMASIDSCLHRMNEECWKHQLTEWKKMTDLFYRMTSKLKVLKVFSPAGSDLFFAKDPSKFVITAEGTNHSGKELTELFRNEYGIELEMASEKYVIAMTGAGDTEEKILRFARAVISIDKKWSEEDQRTSEDAFVYIVKETVMCTPAEAFRLSYEEDAYEELPLSLELKGRVSLEFLYIYPPGIPALVPGEEITEEIVKQAEAYETSGLTVLGYRNAEKKTIRVMKNSSSL